MRSMHVKSAKKKALSELIRQMRKMELGEGEGHDEHAMKSPVAMAEDDVDVDAVDPSDVEDREAALGKDLDGDDEDPRAELEQFMKRGGTRPKPGRATVVMAIKEHGPSPLAKMKKTFGGKTL